MKSFSEVGSHLRLRLGVRMPVVSNAVFLLVLGGEVDAVNFRVIEERHDRIQISLDRCECLDVGNYWSSDLRE